MYHEKHMINKYEFNLVLWDGVNKVMHDFPKMFWVFIAKQTSIFCDTNRQFSWIDFSMRNVSLSCGQEDGSSRHITQYQDARQQVMWQ